MTPEQYIQHLLALLHTQVTKRARDHNAHPTNTEAIWQRYCEENNIKINSVCHGAELTRLRTLIKQVFDLHYDNLSWCEFEKQVLNAPPIDTPLLP